MESKEDIIRKYIKGIVSIESNGKVMYVSTKNCFARTSTLEFLKERLNCKEIDNIGISWDYIRISLYLQTEESEYEHVWEYDGTKDELFSLCFDVK